MTSISISFLIKLLNSIFIVAQLKLLRSGFKSSDKMEQFLVCRLLFSLSILAFALGLTEVFSPDSNFEEITRRYSRYRSLKPRYSSKSLNLDATLNLYGTCLVHLVNYEHVNIRPFKFPVIQSRYDIIEQRFLVRWNLSNFLNQPTYSKRLRYIPWNKVPRQNNTVEWCKHEWPDFECKDMPVIDLTPFTKPWLCEAHFYLYPPSEPIFYSRSIQSGYYVLKIPGAFRRQFWSASKDRIYGKDIWSANYKIVTSMRHDVLLYNSASQINSWIRGFSEPPLLCDETTTSNRQFLLGHVDSKLISSLTRETSEAIHLTFLCQSCRPGTPFFPVYLGQPQNLGKLRRHIKFLSSSMNYIVSAIFPLGRPPTSSLHLNTKMGRLPELRDLSEIYELLHQPGLSLDNARWELEARVLSAVFANITFVSAFYSVVPGAAEQLQNRIFAMSMLIILPNGRLDQFPFSLHEQALQFVSCGNPYLEGLDFLHITSVYDTTTWLAIGATLLTISMFTTVRLEWSNAKKSKIQRLKLFCRRFVSSFISYTAPLVEDSDSITTSFLENTGFRFVFGAYFLTVVIFSNAFKYKNISDLTMPLARLPFDTLESLVSNNFSIYTRTVYMGGYASFKDLFQFGDLAFFLQIGMHYNHYFNKLGDYTVSEVYSFVHAQEQLRNLWMPQSEFSLMGQRLLNSTQTLPFGYRLMEGFDKQCTLSGKNSSCNILQKCNKTALFLPDVDAHVTYLDAVSENDDKVFLSKNTMVKVRHGFLFMRMVHPRVLKRLRGLQESYIMEWWSNFMVDFVPKIKANHLKTEPNYYATSIHGKILTIFVLWLTAILSCKFIFVLEKIFEKNICRIFLQGNFWVKIDLKHALSILCGAFKILRRIATSTKTNHYFSERFKSIKSFCNLTALNTAMCRKN